MYEINDYIVYGNMNVCKVMDICTPKGVSGDKKYYKLEPIYEHGSTIYTPVNNEKVIMRKVITKEEAEKIIDSIPSIDIMESDAEEKLMEEEYKKAIKTNDNKEWIKVIKTLYIKSQERKNNGKKPEKIVGDYLKIAENLFHGELAISLGMPIDMVGNYIVERMKSIVK
jgi:CarD family transcriptional regulator